MLQIATVTLVFLCGFVVMVLEMIGVLYLAKDFGGSFYVWTSQIGMILTALSLGHTIGGRLCATTFQDKPQMTLMTQLLVSTNSLSAKSCVICGRFSICEIEIRAAHEIMAARTTQFALLVDQFVPALWTEPPMFARNVLVGRCGASLTRSRRICLSLT